MNTSVRLVKADGACDWDLATWWLTRCVNTANGGARVACDEEGSNISSENPSLGTSPPSNMAPGVRDEAINVADEHESAAVRTARGDGGEGECEGAQEGRGERMVVGGGGSDESPVYFRTKRLGKPAPCTTASPSSM